MGKKRADSDFGVESDVWNVAEGYVKLKILLPLVECDKLLKVALYGTESIDNSGFVPEFQKTQMRIEAIYRLQDTLRLIIENTLKLLKKAALEDAKGIKDRIDYLDKYLRAITEKKKNNVTGKEEIKIREDHFRECLNSLRSIKTDILKPLNDSNMIFPQSDEVDLQGEMDRLIHGG